MRPICWLHISDFHLRPADKWSQDVALESMCQNIKQQHDGGTEFDFVLVTGDIAFSGKIDEYLMAENFFNDLQSASGVPVQRIFCVPGNHDVDRSRQKLSFKGARSELSSQNQVDELLAGGDNLDTLLIRQENFRRFQNSFFAAQDRILTEDGLGYVSGMVFDEIKLAIIGLNSAWLAEGGLEDHGKLLIGERQVINALRLAQNQGETPHIVIGMAHHPLRLLQEFDHGPVHTLVEGGFDFFHCGHLHEPNTSLTGPGGSGCLTVAAGAAFQSREFHNSYSIVKLDLRRGTRSVQVYRYNHFNRAFSDSDTKDYPIEVIPLSLCSVNDLAVAIESQWPELRPLSFYLASILLGKKMDLPIPSQNGFVLGSVEVMQDQAEGSLKSKTLEFVTFTNVLRVLSDSMSLDDILRAYGDSVEEYGKELMSLCKLNSELCGRLKIHNRDSQMLAGSEPRESFSHTLRLFDELASSQDWSLLREQAERHLAIDDPDVAAKGRRYLALALANSLEQTDKAEAIGHYRLLIGSDDVEFTDVGNLSLLLFDQECMDEAMDAVIEGIGRFPNKRMYYLEIGNKIVEAAGEKELRLRLYSAFEGQV